MNAAELIGPARPLCAALVLLCAANGCAQVDEPRAPATALKVSGATRVDLPDVLGKPVLVVKPELPHDALAEGEAASFEVEFTVDLRGRVSTSGVVSSTHPALDRYILASHRDWLYAVATRADLCATRRFRARQRIEITRRDGKLSSALSAAEVLEVLQRVDRPKIDEGSAPRVPNYRRVMNDILYPTAALRQGVQGRLALLVEFDADGRVSDAYPVNAAYDEWGFAHAAIAAARRLRMDPPPEERLIACLPVMFLIR